VGRNIHGISGPPSYGRRRRYGTCLTRPSCGLPDRIREPVIPIPKHLMKELEEIVEHSENEPELIHWYHFVPCAGVRYYSYHTSPSPVDPLVRREG